MSFKNIKGQAGPIKFLQNAVKDAKLSHAYLFIGPESVGKKLVAATLAKAVNCERGGQDSCDECVSCRKIDKEVHPDVHWILSEGPAGMIKIEKVRRLKNNIVLKPYEAKTKFYIIDRAHRMNDEAANSLLKVLEEPPPNSVVILISEKLEGLFYTIRSRCQIVRFSAMSSSRLEEILKTEFNIPGEACRFLALSSSGRIGKALTLKDTNTLSWKNRIIDRFTKENIIFSEDSFFFSNNRETHLRMLSILAMWYRDALVLKSSGAAHLIINRDRIAEIESLAKRFSSEELLDILEEIDKSTFLIQRNVNVKLTLASLICKTGA